MCVKERTQSNTGGEGGGVVYVKERENFTLLWIRLLQMGSLQFLRLAYNTCSVFFR